MIIVGVIGILSSLVLPAYQDYSVRTKMSEVILALTSCRVSVTEVYQIGPDPAPGPNGWGCEAGATPGTTYVSSVTTTADGVTSATVRGIATAVNGAVVTLAPLAPPAPGTPATFVRVRASRSMAGAAAALLTAPRSRRATCHHRVAAEPVYAPESNARS